MANIHPITAKIRAIPEITGLPPKARDKSPHTRALNRFIREPPRLYSATGSFPSFISGGLIRHCPPVPGRLNFRIRICPSSFSHMKLKARKEQNR